MFLMYNDLIIWNKIHWNYIEPMIYSSTLYHAYLGKGAY